MNQGRMAKAVVGDAVKFSAFPFGLSPSTSPGGTLSKPNFVPPSAGLRTGFGKFRTNGVSGFGEFVNPD